MVERACVQMSRCAAAILSCENRMKEVWRGDGRWAKHFRLTRGIVTCSRGEGLCFVDLLLGLE